ncbi:MAG: tRNA pseudouridine(55) synthase TruB [Ruminococcus callidus]|nr:tRNA pseudouridine(55) synthase TruB [Ruminococcus sp.]MDY6144502.1 tRNA pseudouridine(55) synthase TruB [Ruminococcus callidus]
MNKPQDFTSFDVIGKLRGILHMKRLGHTGTLDPMATGVLPILVGTATKACDILPNQDKTYQATVVFGKATDTLDIWGKPLQNYPEQHVTEAALRAILPEFLGDITQLPPMYSAVSVNGKRLYELARKGETVERPTRTVHIDAITLDAFDETQQTATLTVSCGKGTYIRTLLSDIGQRLGGDAVMTALTRTAACGYPLQECLTFEQVAAAMADGTLEEHLLPTDSLFSSYPKLRLNAAQERMFCNGVKLDLNRLRNLQPDQDIYTVYGATGTFLGTALADRTQQELRIGKRF